MAIVAVQHQLAPRRWPSCTRLANPSSRPRGNNFLIAPLKDIERRDLLEVLEDRYGTSST
jgi:hypothetical protein